MHPPRVTSQVTDRNVENLSGGELQRFAIAAVALQVRDEQKNVAAGMAMEGLGIRRATLLLPWGFS